jgi:hypothetical protein
MSQNAGPVFMPHNSLWPISCARALADLCARRLWDAGAHSGADALATRHHDTDHLLLFHGVTNHSERIVEPHLTALAIVGRLSELYPDLFCNRQHSIVQRLLKALRRKAAERLTAEMMLTTPITLSLLPAAVDCAACDGHSAPPTASFRR